MLKTAIAERGLTICELAKKIKRHRTGVARALDEDSDEKGLSLHLLLEIAAALDCRLYVSVMTVSGASLASEILTPTKP